MVSSQERNRLIQLDQVVHHYHSDRQRVSFPLFYLLLKHLGVHKIRALHFGVGSLPSDLNKSN